MGRTASRGDSPPIRPSILDRLLDDDPAAEIDPPVSSHRQLRQLRDAIRRDLHNLLNTRRRCLSCPEELREAARSSIEYGLDDLSAANLASDEDQEDLLGIVEETVRHFEPRFKSVRVSPVTSDNPHDRTLRFRIDARVYAEPTPEEVVFDSSVEPVRRGVDVGG